MSIKLNAGSDTTTQWSPSSGIKLSASCIDKYDVDLDPGMEGFWESFWRNGLLIAIIQKCKSTLENTSAKCEQYIKDPTSFDNGNVRHDINAIKVFPKSKMIPLCNALYNLGNQIKKDASNVAKADAKAYIRLLSPCGFEVSYDKVKGQYRWNCGSIWGKMLVAIGINIGTWGLYGLANAVTLGKVNREVEKGLHAIPASMREKGYKTVSDYKALCQAVKKVCDQALTLKTVKAIDDGDADKAKIKLVKSAIDVYQREVREIGYAMVKVFVGLNSGTGLLAKW